MHQEAGVPGDLNIFTERGRKTSRMLLNSGHRVTGNIGEQFPSDATDQVVTSVPVRS